MEHFIKINCPRSIVGKLIVVTCDNEKLRTKIGYSLSRKYAETESVVLYNISSLKEEHNNVVSEMKSIFKSDQIDQSISIDNYRSDEIFPFIAERTFNNLRYNKKILIYCMPHVMFFEKFHIRIKYSMYRNFIIVEENILNNDIFKDIYQSIVYCDIDLTQYRDTGVKSYLTCLSNSKDSKKYIEDLVYNKSFPIYFSKQKLAEIKENKNIKENYIFSNYVFRVIKDFYLDQEKIIDSDYVYNALILGSHNINNWLDIRAKQLGLDVTIQDEKDR